MKAHRFALVLLAALVASPRASGEDYPLSLQLEVLERDLANPDYLALVQKMIPTDLRAEWQRVATPDNYHVFAEQQGGLDKLNADAKLKAAYERRKQIATEFLAVIRAAYEEKKQKPPFAEEAVLNDVLSSAGRVERQKAQAQTSIEPILPALGAEKQWPGFRGPTAQGIVRDTNIPLEWSNTKNVVWRKELPGRGNSSPVIWGEKLLVTAESERRADDAALRAMDAAPKRLLLCYSLSGELLWQHAAPQPAEHEVLYWKNTLASATPVTDGERVIVFFGNAGLVCTDLDGKRLWHVDLGTFPTTHGPASAPVLYKDLVILIQDQNKGKSLCAAFDKRRGQVVWQHERKNSMGWSNPVLLRVGDRDEMIFNGSNEITSYDPATGEVLWTCAETSIESIPMIAFGGGLLFSTSGRNGPIFAIRTGGSGDITDTHLVWRLERGGPHVTSPAYHGGRLYLAGDTGIITCMGAASGETLWQKRLRGRISASPLLVDDKLLFISEEGTTYVVKSGPEFELLGENPLDETIYATPAVVGGRIYFRTNASLICVGK